MSDIINAPVIHPEIIKIAVRAYDAGHRLVCSWIDAGLTNCGVGVSIQCAPPDPEITLEECRRALKNALTAYRCMTPELPPDDQVCPWMIYHRKLPDGKNEGMGISLAAHPSQSCLEWTDEKYWRSEIERIFSVKHSYGWCTEDFQQCVVDIVEFQSTDWIRYLRLRKGPWQGKPPEWESDCVQLFGPGERPIVNGQWKPKLTPGRYEIIKALIQAGDSGLGKDELESEHPSARRMLRQLIQSDPDWKAVLSPAVSTGSRYHIR